MGGVYVNLSELANCAHASMKKLRPVHDIEHAGHVGRIDSEGFDVLGGPGAGLESPPFGATRI